MRDLPFFITDNGVADLILKEIPYKQTAYIRVREAQPGELDELIGECRSFCRMAGADDIYATGHPELDRWPLYTEVLAMRGTAGVDREKLCSLFPVTDQTVAQWRKIYNERMASVHNSATLESRDEKRIVESAGAYFVHENGELLGIGWLEDTALLAVASVKSGAGEKVMHTLMSLVEGAVMSLEVASTNGRAIKLYEKLGFLPVASVSRWYDVSGA